MNRRTEILLVWSGLFTLYFVVGVITGGTVWWSIVYAGLASALLYLIGRIVNTWDRLRTLRSKKA